MVTLRTGRQGVAGESRRRAFRNHLTVTLGRGGSWGRSGTGGLLTGG